MLVQTVASVAEYKYSNMRRLEKWTERHVLCTCSDEFHYSVWLSSYHWYAKV